jgi:hypothetical protein
MMDVAPNQLTAHKGHINSDSEKRREGKKRGRKEREKEPRQLWRSTVEK